jgi:RNA polymerase sigma factor (sigma-70 family)
MLTDRNDASLLRGDAAAFAEFYGRHEDAILGFFLKRSGKADVAADLTAEVFARALEGRRRFDLRKGDARGWLFGIARNLLAASLDRGRVEDGVRRRLGMEPLALDDNAIDRILALDDQRATRALASLPVEQAAAIVGRVVEDRGYGELAANLECSESLVRQRVSRGLRAMRSRLEEDDDAVA